MPADLRQKNDEDQDEWLNSAKLKSLEQDAGDDQFDGIANNYDKTADDGQENENIEKAKAAVAGGGNSGWETTVGNSPSDDKKPVRFLGARKKSASIFITLGLLGGGVGVSFFSLPGLLLVQMKEVITNYGSSASRAAPARYNKMLKYTIGNDKAAAACAKSATSKKCKLGTMSKEQRANYEKEGFKFKGTDFDGRTHVTSVEFPDGTKVTNGDDFIKHTKKSPAAASAASRAHNPSTKVYNGGRFTNFLKKVFGLNRSKENVSGKNNDERKKDFNKRTGNDISDDERSSRFKEKYRARITTAGAIKAAGAISSVAALTCAGYNIAKLTVAAVKVENGLRFAAFAFQFLKAADQIKNKGDIEPETASFLGTVLTATTATGPKAGLSATDSQGYKIAAYGGEGLLRSWTAAFLLGGNPVLITIDNTIQFINKELGRRNVRAVCRGAANLFVAGGITAAICGGSAVAGAGGATFILPGAGTIVGLVLGFLGCFIGQISLAVAIIIGRSLITGWMVEHVLGFVVKMLSKSNLDVNKISGVDAGNGIAVGAGVMLGTTALSRGLKPGSKSDVTTFVAATAEDQAQVDKIAVYDAKNEPFNIYNQYSFLGSAVRKTGIAFQMPSSIGEALSSLGSMVGSSIKLIPNAGASPASMPVNIKTADLSACPDLDMKDIGIDCDKMGNPQFVLSPAELAMEVSDNLDYMIPKFVDEDGVEVPNKTYTKWLANCTEQRETPMGATLTPLEDADYDWATGENCVSAEGDGAATEVDLSNFRVYYNTLAEKEDGDYVPPVETQDIAGGSAGDLKVATYNVHNYAVDAGPTDGYDPSDDVRIKGIAALIEKNGLNIVAVQEADGLVRNKLLEYLPENYSASESTGAGGDLIIWDSNLFAQDGNLYKFMVPKVGGNIQNEGNEREAIRVKLKSKETNESVYVFGVHLDTDVEGRRIGANIVVDELKKVAESGDEPVIVAGDMNSNYSQPSRDQAYTTFNAYGKIVITSQATDNRVGYNCDTENGGHGRQQCRSSTGSHLDQIWVTKNTDIKVDKWENIATQETAALSDHNPVLADLVMPGLTGSLGGDSTTGGSIDGDDYVKDCSKYLKSGYYCPGQSYDYQCTAFVNFRLAKHGVIKPTDIVGGSGGAVVGTLKGKDFGFETGKVAQVNSVFSTRQTSNPSAGHTGMVSKVNSDGSIVIEEYNFNNPRAYGTRTLTKSEYEGMDFTFAYVGGSYR